MNEYCIYTAFSSTFQQLLYCFFAVKHMNLWGGGDMAVSQKLIQKKVFR